ncbi:ABC transporter ATP-binding protein [Paenibacillus sp. FSL W7-1287]|uniref:ABC transporter ATP-binding protein n=1 Tax=Paenibacillus sp. FSL W7-1287 TaxID=2954538 RepID=UPI0030FD1DA0
MMTMAQAQAGAQAIHAKTYATDMEVNARVDKQADAIASTADSQQANVLATTDTDVQVSAHSGTHHAADEQAIIEVRNVSFCYPGAEVNTLQDVSLRITRGDFVAVIGSNGSGKSTLCKCLNGLIPTYYSGDFEGKVLVNGIDTSSTTIAQLSKHVAYVFQDFENQLVRPTVFDELCFAPLNFGYENYKERAQQALRMLDIEELSKQWIWQLSGGQKHMVALAAALALDPEVIIVDEPVAQLDPAHARLIYEKLAMLNDTYHKTIIVIEHHTEYIADFCKNVILLDQGGRVRWSKPVDAALSAIEELQELHIQPPQVTQAMAALQLRDPATQLYPVTIEHAAQLLQPLPGQQLIQPEHNASSPPEPLNIDNSSDSSDRKALVIIDHATSGYQSMNKQHTATLRDINLTIYEGDRIALVGNNGAGKSTLLRLIAGIRKPWSGSVNVCGNDTRSTTPEQLSDAVSFIFQNPEEMFIADHIREDIEFFLKARKQEQIEPFINHIIDTFNLSELQQRDGRLLSGGQQRRATLAIGLAMKPTVMLLDEPTASLDIVSRREMTKLFDELHEQVQAIVVATHDMQLVADWATRVIVMHNGEILLDGRSEEVFQQPHLLEMAALIPPQIVQLGHRLQWRQPALSVEQFVKRMKQLKLLTSAGPSPTR